jgi:hypothetical protein
MLNCSKADWREVVDGMQGQERGRQEKVTRSRLVDQKIWGQRGERFEVGASEAGVKEGHEVEDG